MILVRRSSNIKTLGGVVVVGVFITTTTTSSTISSVSASASASTKEDSSTTTPDEEEYLECDLYIAESTIPHAGLGIFTAIEKQVGDVVGDGDVAFPMFELDWHNGVALQTPEYYDPFADYVWDGVTMGMAFECESDSTITALWPGLDCAINCNVPLENVHRAFPTHPATIGPFPIKQNQHDDGANNEINDNGSDKDFQLEHDPYYYLPHHSKHPAAGAVTPYRSGTTVVSRRIPPGGELFKFYGENW